MMFSKTEMLGLALPCSINLMKLKLTPVANASSSCVTWILFLFSRITFDHSMGLIY